MSETKRIITQHLKHRLFVCVFVCVCVCVCEFVNAFNGGQT